MADDELGKYFAGTDFVLLTYAAIVSFAKWRAEHRGAGAQAGAGLGRAQSAHRVSK